MLKHNLQTSQPIVNHQRHECLGVFNFAGVGHLAGLLPGVVVQFEYAPKEKRWVSEKIG